MKKVFQACGLCGKNDFKFLFANFDHLTKKDEYFNLVKCKCCGLVQINPKPKDIEEYYYESYSPYNPPKKDFYISFYRNLIKSYYKKKKTPVDLVKSALCGVLYFQPVARPGRVFDIGCGNGGYLSILKDCGWDVYGLDFSQKAVDFVKNKRGLINIKQGSAEKLDFPDNFFDLVTMNHLIEHLSDPKKSLYEAKRVLKKGGILMITTPNFSSLNAKIFGGNWFPLETPRHLFLFETKTLRNFIDQVGNLKITKIRYDYSTYCLAKSLGYLFGDRPLLNQFLMIVKIFFLPYTLLLSLLGCSDIITIYGQKQ